MESMQAAGRLPWLQAAVTTTHNPTNPIDNPILDPRKRAYVADLLRTLLEGRVIVGMYNIIAMLLLLLAFAAVHWYRSRRDRRKWRERIARLRAVRGSSGSSTPPAADSEEFSSSSSTVSGTASPLVPYKDDDDQEHVDLERRPLLRLPVRSHPSQGNLGGSRSRSTVFSRFRGWLAYQPRPIPIINRSLPSNAVSIFVLAWVAMSVFFFLFRSPLSGPYFFVPADRAGFVFIVNLPLLYLLAAKNQPIRLLTGRSYESLNIFHRRVGELMCFAAVVHMGGMLLFQFVLAPPWLNPVTPWQYFTTPLIVLGLGTFVSYELLYLTSLASIRQRCYELFLATHVMLQLVALVLLFFHFPTSRGFVLLSLLIFVLDRVVWRLKLKSVSLDADLCILQDGETLMLSADWDIPSSSCSSSSSGLRSALSRVFRHKDITAGWRPTDHVFLTVPALGRTHALQTHPFTIASGAPFSLSNPEDADATVSKPTHAWFNLLIRTHSGFTKDLLDHARRLGSSTSSPPLPSEPVRLRVRLDGPYGSCKALDMLRASDTAVLVAGGSGIAVVYSLAAALLLDDQRLLHDAGEASLIDLEDRLPSAPAPAVVAARPGRQRVHLLWVRRSRSHADWIPQERLDELVQVGLNLIVPEPTNEAGRPDTAGFVREICQSQASSDAWTGGVGVVVSGPDGMNREVRNVCAAAIGDGVDVRIAVEKFGW
ncbi:hypothetical protein MAPG_02812 [Magnaporthiopsis poae ATCC 64411]|uniref:FAD-binding FR-type domain-containing protein n=1 Tax=Magnaporthiopsis poae (strain ATCC 64411 / 73-15) TaxID=644358 RepID=A0A0C4DSD4_MAGP6|nr:hypothetical protein MAPG_02812 [Magnaporthiopsis poae ATCC 64411]